MEQMKLDVLEIPPIWMSTFGGENIVILSRNDHDWRLMLTEVGLPFWVQRRVAPVAVETRELDLGIPVTCQTT